MMRQRIGLSIDITSRCTLNCQTCYMRWYEQIRDLSLHEWESLIEEIPEKERLVCAWTGGEPFLRIDDLKDLTRFFRWNWVATNGTLPLERIPRTTILVSVDGTREIHNQIRGGWDKITENIIDGCYIAYDITSLNSSREILEETIRFWRDKTEGVIYSFYTPNVKGNSSLYLSREEKLRVLEDIRELKEEYGRFIVNSIDQLHYCITFDWSDDCPAARTLLALDSEGKPKKPCVLGSDVDCTRCGCAVPSFMRFTPSTIREGIRVFGGIER